MEVLMTRYILEVMQDVDLLKLYGNGWYPNMDDYAKFFHKQEKNNEYFAKTIERYKLIRSDDCVFESVFSNELKNISDFIDNKSTTLKLGYGSVNIDSKLILESLDYKKVYISNGIYRDTYEICNRIINHRGSFAVGVCDNPDSIFYKENKERAKDIESLLKKRRLPYLICKRNNHNEKTYIISYRGSK